MRWLRAQAARSSVRAVEDAARQRGYNVAVARLMVGPVPRV